MPQLPKPPGERVRRSSSQSNGRALPAADQAPPEVDERHRLLAHQFGLPARLAALIDLDQPLDQVFANAKALQRHVHVRTARGARGGLRGSGIATATTPLAVTRRSSGRASSVVSCSRRVCRRSGFAVSATGGSRRSGGRKREFADYLDREAP